LVSLTKPTHWAPQEPTPKVMVAQCHALLELLLVAPVGRAQHPSQSLLRSTTQSALRASTETTIKLSWRWQPPRVTSTTVLQLDHLVPPRCNLSMKSHYTHLQSIHTLASTSELEGSQVKHTQGQHIPKVLNLSIGWPPSSFIAPRAKIAVTLFILISVH
jgi:hypothetical protein